MMGNSWKPRFHGQEHESKMRLLKPIPAPLSRSKGHNDSLENTTSYNRTRSVMDDDAMSANGSFFFSLLFLFRFVFLVFRFFCFLSCIECSCACRIQYDGMALHCLLCLLHNNAVSPWRSFVTTGLVQYLSRIEESARTLVVLDVDR